MRKLSPVLWSLIMTTACGGRSPNAVEPAGSAVTLNAAAPPAGYEKLKELQVVSGQGCGLLGERGSPEGAEAKMRSEAAKLGASYVQLIKAEKPPINHQCAEHAHKLSGVAYRVASPPATAAAPKPPLPAATPAVAIIQDYEKPEPASKPAASTGRSSIALALVPGEPSGNALSVQYMCSGDDQRADLDVWTAPLATDWSHARALTLRVKPSAALALSVSFMDGNHAGYTQLTDPLVAGEWQAVLLPFDKFLFNPFGPPGDVKGAPQDRAAIAAFGFAPRGCNNGHFLIDDFKLAE